MLLYIQIIGILILIFDSNNLMIHLIFIQVALFWVLGFKFNMILNKPLSPILGNTDPHCYHLQLKTFTRPSWMGGEVIT